MTIDQFTKFPFRMQFPRRRRPGARSEGLQPPAFRRRLQGFVSSARRPQSVAVGLSWRQGRRRDQVPFPGAAPTRPSWRPWDWSSPPSNGRRRAGSGQDAKRPQPLPSGAGGTQFFYRDADGGIAFVVVRRDTADDKTFSQWTPAGDDDLYLPKGPKGKRPLYGLPGLMAQPEELGVTVVEGEKCVDAFVQAWPKSAGLVTTWSGGTKSWRKTDWSALSGRAVNLIADADTPGREAMKAIAAHLHGLDCNVRIALPEGETGDDIADGIEQDAAAALKFLKDRLEDYDPSDAQTSHNAQAGAGRCRPGTGPSSGRERLSARPGYGRRARRRVRLVRRDSGLAPGNDDALDKRQSRRGPPEGAPGVAAGTSRGLRRGSRRQAGGVACLGSLAASQPQRRFARRPGRRAADCAVEFDPDTGRNLHARPPASSATHDPLIRKLTGSWPAQPQRRRLMRCCSTGRFSIGAAETAKWQTGYSGSWAGR